MGNSNFSATDKPCQAEDVEPHRCCISIFVIPISHAV